MERARTVNPDKATNPAQSLEEYYEFVSNAESAMPWRLLPAKSYPTVYEGIDQSLAYLYFVADQPLPQLEGRGYFNNSLQYVEPFGAWLKAFVKSWGAFMDTPDSWNDEYYRRALADEHFGLAKGWYEDPSNWKTFNQFFARRLKSPNERPIASPGDPAVLVSPADAVPQGLWAIDGKSRLIEAAGVPVKSGTVTSVEQLIGPGSRYQNAFAGGTLTHLFLDVGDYHRYHVPVDGIVREAAIVPGGEVTGGYITWDAANNRYAFDPSAAGWQSLETRGRLIVETDGFGLVAIMPIGMSPVSSVSLEPVRQEGTRVKKGDPMGHFRFGGSDFVLVFQAGIEFVPDSPKAASGHPFQCLVKVDVERADGGPVQPKDPSALEHAIDDRLCEILVV